MDATQGYGGAPDAAREQGPQVAAGGYGESRPEYAGEQRAQWQDSAYASAQAGAGGPHGYDQTQQPGQGQFAYGGMPPGYAQPAPGPWTGAPNQSGYYPPPHAAPYPPGGAPYYGYAGYAPPPPPGAYPPDAFQGMHQGYAQGAGASAGLEQGAGMSDLMNEVANGGNGLSTLSKMLDFNDPDFWKGALVGAAAVLLLTSESVQNALFKSGNANGNGEKESEA